MRKVNPKLNSQSGVSLVELLVVILVIAIVASFAIIGRGRSNEAFQLENAAYGLKNSFERARFDSVKRRPETDATSSFVEVATQAYALAVDRDTDAVLENDEKISISTAGQAISIGYFTGTGSIQTGMPITVRFNRRGEPALFFDGSGTASTTQSPVFCLSNSFGSMTVLVTPAGTVNVLRGCGGVPTFGIPTLTNVPGSDLINTLVSNLGVAPSGGIPPTPPPGGGNGGGYPPPTPTPSGTPTATPAPTPTPTGTPGPTPTPTGTPTPTPTGTPTPTPTATPSCALTAPTATSITYSGNGPRTIPVSFINGSGNTITASVSGGGSDWAVSPTSATALGASGTFNLTFSYQNGNNGRGTGTLTISGCGTKTVTLTVTN